MILMNGKREMEPLPAPNYSLWYNGQFGDTLYIDGSPCRQTHHQLDQSHRVIELQHSTETGPVANLVHVDYNQRVMFRQDSSSQYSSCQPSQL